MILFNIKLNRAIGSQFLHNLHNDTVSSIHDLPILGNKQKNTLF